MYSRNFCLAVLVVCSSWISALTLLGQAGCQNQQCNLAYGGCYKCTTGPGEASSIPPNHRCSPTCTNTACFFGTQDAAAGCKVSDEKLAQLREPRLVLAAFQSSSFGMAFVISPGSTQDPVLLVSATHNADKDFFESGRAENQSSSNLTAYRVGWLLFARNPNVPPVVGKGPIMNVPEGIKPGEQFDLLGQNVNPALFKDYKMIVFFIAEAKLADGTEWQANTSRIQSEYQKRVDAEDKNEIDQQ